MAGTVEKRGKNSYRLTIYDGFDTNGKRIRHRKNVICKSDREAKNELANFYAEVRKGNMYNCKSITLKEFSDIWLKEYAEPNLAPRTVERYKSLLNVHILSEIGNMKLLQIKPFDLNKLYNRLSKKHTNRLDEKGNYIPLSNNSIIKVHKLLSVMFNTAISWGMLPYNICNNVKHLKEKHTEMSFYNVDEVEELIKSLDVESIKYRTIVILAIMTGLRRGEILGLHWSDIDFETGKVAIQRSVQYLAGIGISEKCPKTETSKRTIVIPKFCIVLLKELEKENLKQRLLLSNKYIVNDNVFVTKTGEIMHPDTISSWFAEFIKKNNLRKIRFHDLRHTSATIMLSEGINIKVVSKQLGHNNISITNRYVHALENSSKEVANIFDNIANESKINKYNY